MMKDNCLKNGTVLRGRYNIKKVLGIGGFGVTYLVEDRILEQKVVIKEYFPQEIAGRMIEKNGEMKVVPREKNDSRRFLKGKKDFLEEARRMSKLFDILEIVKILDWFEENGTAYLAMEYIRGISLDDYLQNQDVPFSFQQAWEMLKPVAEALEKIHKMGIIHRDLNPGNLMIEENGTIKIIDFGSARPYLETEKTMTILIKKGYAPPEQYVKKGKQGPWTDIYAFCATIYEMITGVRPEPSIQRIEKDELYPPSAYGAEILPEEEKILCRGLELNYKHRFRKMSDLCDCLKNAGQPIEAEVKEIKKPQWILPLTLVGIAMAVCAAGAGFFFSDTEEPQKQTYAGNYGRQSDRYEEYIEFVKHHAVSREKSEKDELYESYPYRGLSTIYTLKSEDVKEWGEPCNRFRFDMKGDDYIKWMKKKGYLLEKKGQNEKNTVEIEKYGAIRTYFRKEKEYVTKNNVHVSVVSDTVNDDLFGIYFVTPEGTEEEGKNVIQETAEFLIQDFPSNEKGREVLENLYEEMPRNSQIDPGFNFLLKQTEKEESSTWDFTVDHWNYGLKTYLWE
ncbi:MAG TPA: serine/threonine protein kinase [Candidatus Anaerostipes avistercoris]|uniref:Serine/threonine protein kinase n=1 Tax=Candidatus Anaerostipes avistercoris TaxID=2838462 RepID=A0A9D2PHM0_9FIRM|nr:serine/threonine protein kinase [Candidatus Anaerostipes avistercoris]